MSGGELNGHAADVVRCITMATRWKDKSEKKINVHSAKNIFAHFMSKMWFCCSCNNIVAKKSFTS